MSFRTLKTAALATLVVIATAGVSMAAQYAWVDNNTKVKAFHKQNSANVNWVQAGQKVKVVGQWNNWYKLQIPGPDGWVKGNVLSFGPQFPGPFPGYGYGYGGSFCVNGQNASFCLSGGY
ncbi:MULTISPECIES: SH3 domain-containing protein [unclassified Devosia]|jgi:hypothetical protein|uniref:SH3 domain-containing protein n=1 Tax=unclassified Devosia TaxID=196773 RepID=UPI00086B2616|nr:MULTISPECIES: SH3 domain-containing protein [unclassified Devosia]MBN9364001.1 SH3 domain-containing protein [Devosia sp.]ODS82903.1 MAG: hypothetical protein ABS47_21755 [Devosia sp. SCN 66-27]OJX27263.1 MAG: hypothetical protein BGO83_26105 [Devosia sp. 66-14]